MKRFDVIVRLDDDTRELAGVLAMGDPAANGRYAAEFRYEPAWLESKRGFTLDPESLPLSGRTFPGSNLNRLRRGGSLDCKVSQQNTGRSIRHHRA